MNPGSYQSRQARDIACDIDHGIETVHYSVDYACFHSQVQTTLNCVEGRPRQAHTVNASKSYNNMQART